MKKIALAAAMLMSTSAFAADNTLTWDDVDGEDGYTVYAKNEACGPTGSVPYTPIGNTSPNGVSYVHTVTGTGFDWCYKVTAYNANGESGFSNEAGKVPAVPGTLIVN